MDRRHLFLLAALAAVFLAQLWLRPLLPVDETRYVAVAWEMRLSGDWAHLTRNFESYAHKPPLLFWLINLVWLVAGVSEFAARLVGPACTLAVAALTGWLARRLWPGRPGLDLRAMAVLGGTTAFLLYGGATMFDALLALAVLPGIGVVWALGQGVRGPRPWAALGLCLALGVYAKGPVILVHLLPVLLLMRFWAPLPLRAGEMARGLALSVGLALALVAAWLVPALLAGDAAFRDEILLRQTVDRVAGGLRHDRPFWFLLVLLPVLLWPFAWSWGVLRTLPGAARADAAGRFCATWAGATLVAFSLISGKQLHYLLPAVPAFALLAARGAAGAGARARSAAGLVPLAMGLLALAASAGLVALPAAMEGASAAALAGLGAAFLLLAGLAFRLPLWPGHAVAGAGLALALHGAVAVTPAGANLDAHRAAAVLAPRVAGGLAVVGTQYNAEWNFALRLTAPVATPEGAQALADWARAHPGGAVIAPLGRPPVAAAPAATMDYAGRRFGLWPAAAVTSPGSDPAG